MEPAELMVLRQDWVTSKQEAHPSIIEITFDFMENPVLPDLVVAQSQHLQVFKLPDAARNFSEAIVVQ